VVARKDIDYGSAILIAGSPIEDRYEIPSGPDAVTPPQQAKSHEGESQDEQTAVAVLAPEDDLKVALLAERREGRKLLKALRGNFFESWQYDRVPTADDVHGWRANVEHLLRDEGELLQLLRWQPLTRSMGISFHSVTNLIVGGPETRRLERLLEQLDKVIERLSR
jgi:hypothetical protein